MKKFKLLSSAFCAAMLTCGLTLTSCGSDSNQISKSQIEEAIENLPIMNDSVFANKIRTGYFEVDRHNYVMINRMMQAELVTASFEIKKHKTVEYSGYRLVEVLENHIFANVSLTEKGRKYVVSDEQNYVRKDYKDIYEKLYPENKEEKDEEYLANLPEYMTLPDVVTDYYDKAITKGEKREPNEEIVSDTTQYDDETEDITSIYDYRSDEELDEYEKALKKVDVKRVKVLCGKIEIDEIFNIQCTEEMQKEGTASCSFLVKSTDLTPFGIILDFKEDEYSSCDIRLKKYIDKGWIVTDLDNSSLRSSLIFKI